MEIEKILASHGATGIMKEYDDNGKVTALSFKAKVGEYQQEVGFRLPAKKRAMLNITTKLVNERKLPRSALNDEDRAMRIGWRIIKDWIDSQMALIEIDLCDIAELFLPYAYDGEKTLYNLFEEKGFDLLEGGRQETKIIEVE